ncbi:putative RNA-directed DNA polymerase from transposon X-element [Trichonephila clavipes]|nr:putative RNA-directed DNA polymerase from transposon X-element [Trichonephila clavipes]
MKAQKVCDVRRITIRRDGQVLNTKHLILTFSTPDLPQTIKMAYIRCPVRPYIPNPLRCFQCQRYGHSKNVCWGQPTCPRCGESGHGNADCTKKEQCLNCKAKPTNQEVIAKSKSNSPSKTKVIAKPPSKSPPPAKKTIIKRTQSDSPKRPRSRRARQRDQRPTLARIPKKISRDFHRKIEQDTLTGDCSEDDEALMDIQSGPSTSSSGGGASAAL